MADHGPVATLTPPEPAPEDPELKAVTYSNTAELGQALVERYDYVLNGMVSKGWLSKADRVDY